MRFGSARDKTGGRIAAAALAGVSLLALNTALHAQPTNVQPATARPAGTINVSVPAGSLESGLLSLGRQANLRMLYPSNLTAGKHTAGVSGQVSPQQAVTQLLAGTGLRASFTGQSTVQVFDPSAPAVGGAMPAGAITLDTIDVQGAGNPNALIGNPPPAYPGGQVARGGQVGILGNRDFMNTPFNQSNYTSKLMQDQQVQHVSEALKNDPSVYIGFFPSTGRDSFTIRGFGVSTGDILFNGLAGIAPSGATSMVAESVERVEVLKGPNAMLNGIGADGGGGVGGAINIVPKRAGDEPLTQFTPGYAMNSQFGGHIDVGRRFGSDKEFGVRFNGVYRDGDLPIHNQSRESRLATLGLDYRGKRVRLSADLGYQYQGLEGVREVVSIAATGAVPNAPDSRRNFNAPWAFSNSKIHYGTLRGEFDVTDRVTAFAAIGGNHREWQAISTRILIINANGDVAAGNATLRGEKILNKTTQIGLRGSFETGPISHQATIAHNWYNSEWRENPSSFALAASNIYSPTYGSAPNPALIPDPDHVPRLRDTVLKSIVVGDTLSVLNERVQLTLGARLQQIYVQRFDATTGAVTSSYDEDAITPMVGLVVKPWSNVSLYGNYIEGLQQGQTAPSTAANAGEIFSPYVTKQYEVGAKVDFGRIATTISVYQVALPSTYTEPSTNIFGVYGQQRHRGVELNMFGEITEDVRLLGGVSYIDSELTETVDGTNNGNIGIGVPAYRLVAGAEWDTPFLKGLTLTGRVTRTSSAYLNAANTLEIPGWTQLDIGARYQIERAEGKPIIIRASIGNVLGSDYWVSASNGTMSLSDPLTLKLSTTFNF